MSFKYEKNWLIFLLVLLIGVVLGGAIGEYLGKIPALGFLKYGDSFGISPPFSLQLGIITFTLGLNLDITIGGIIGLLIAMLIFKKL